MIDEAAIRARCAAATPGPWQYSSAYVADHGREREVFSVIDPGCWTARCQSENDTIFIAYAREDIPALLDELARLRAEHDIAIAGTVNWDSGAVAWTTEPPPFVHSPGYEANEIDARDLGY